MKKQQSGFTLIELVIVIVILGLLAATALPRFADLTEDAERAARDGVEGGVRSAAAIAHAQALVSGATASQSIVLEGATITMTNKYPTADAAGIGAAVDTGNISLEGATGWVIASGCTVTYAAAPANGSPSIGGTTSGCNP